MNRSCRGRGESGSVSATVLVLPLLLGVVFLTAQFAVAWHARQICQAAAQDGARAVQGTSGSSEAGRTAAAAFVDDNGSTVLDDVRVSVVAGADTAEVTVSGEVVPVVPGWSITVHGRAVGPVERFRPSPAGG